MDLINIATHPKEWNQDPRDDTKSKLSMFEKNVVSGFNLAIASGPLCNEPIAGVIFLLESFSVKEGHDELDSIFNFTKT